MDNPDKLATLCTQDTGQINVRENRRDNQERTIKINWQHYVHKTQDEDKTKQKQKQKITTQYALDPTLRKQTKIM
jgi:hypothetical protein